MIIAFIDNPIQTIFVYILLLVFTAVLPLTLFFITGLKHHYYGNHDEIDDDKDGAIVFGFMGLSICYYFVCLILLFTIGGFNNFNDLQNLLWLLLGTLVTALGRHIFIKLQKKMNIQEMKIQTSYSYNCVC